MNTKPCILLLLFIAVLFSAGCVSFGTQTTDLILNNETVGNVTIMPDAEGSYSLMIHFFGIALSKEGLTFEEASALSDTMEENPAALFELLSGDIISSEEGKDFFSSLLPENAGEPTDIDEFLDSIVNMPLTNSGNTTISDSLSLSDVSGKVHESLCSLENLVSGIIGA